ncbi:MAG: tRNA (N6-threonylcarbamoyladenosine(37)-N6)-methyltransferase TrmO [Firmicutes bacterium]|nr:tRNA (N6-threonylcarbamoyladenosine(37)-N6)-methyltransferase TrmO [Bacillota bacterium]MDD7601416.1 tRNA (N6-threonylcarbamoyladenosine(37)-N6)-methyltransferase TrmO [Bacillota bacterium]MDY5856108.1 tRNA (N6-threonylcarbamoyladenosine(37)-N6)-methyltransferase TrmO [Anaerovoracaceae bacterium]
MTEAAEKQPQITAMRSIGYVRSDFPAKFGIPRQSGLVDTRAEVVLVPPFNKPEAVRGLEEFSHIWLLWEFSENIRLDGSWSATVRPPRLGGNERKGVFATRSPFRPNPIGLSCVKLDQIRMEAEGPVLQITGADLMNGTPVYDIKPYVAYSDSVPDAAGGFSDRVRDYHLDVEIPQDILEQIPQGQRDIVKKLLSQDPRPSYQEDPERIYGMPYGGMDIRFRVRERTLTVTGVEKLKK